MACNRCLKISAEIGIESHRAISFPRIAKDLGNRPPAPFRLRDDGNGPVLPVYYNLDAHADFFQHGREVTGNLGVRHVHS